MKKFFAFLLGVLMLCSAFVMNSCEENDGDDTAETTKPSVSTIIDDVKKTTNDSSDVVDPEETTNGGDVVDPEETTNGSSDVVNPDIGGKNVLDGVRYNGETIYVYGWIPSNIAEQVQEFSSELGVVEQNVYKRLDETQKQLNIKVYWKEERGNGSHPEFIQNAVNANTTGAYDAICAYSQWAAALTTQGVSKNLLQFNTLDFTHPAWPKDMVDQLTIFDKLYFCTGDISTNLILMTSVVFVNTDMVSTWRINEKIQRLYGEENIYDLVREGKWTYDAMFKLTDGIWQDNDFSGGSRTAGDTYGLGTYNTLLFNFYAGAGYTLIESDENGIYLSEDYTDVDAIEKLLKDVVKPLYDDGFCRSYENSSANARDSFANGLNLFSLAPASHAYVKHYHTDNLKYAALPVPKYDAAQDGYHSYHSNPYTNYVVASGSANPQIAASFLQGLAQRSYDTTRIAIFEHTMKARFAQGDSDVAEMWEMVVDSQTFDLGRIFAESFRHGGNGTILINQFNERIESGKTGWENIMNSYQQDLIDMANALNALIATLPGD
ncbi:MAG: extracellular solute-binding protein [Clostridia bacterium]|nr:extracellular solute-binding protein [Clostridia bacterium]